MTELRCPSCDVVIAQRGNLPSRCEWCKQDFPLATRQRLANAHHAQVVRGTAQHTSETSNVIARLRGIGMLLLGALLGLGCIVDPFIAASQGVTSFPVWHVGIIAVPSLIGFGLLYLAWGKQTRAVLEHPSRKLTRIGWILSLLLGGIGLLLFFALFAYVASRGYELSH